MAPVEMEWWQWAYLALAAAFWSRFMFGLGKLSGLRDAENLAKEIVRRTKDGECISS